MIIEGAFLKLPELLLSHLHPRDQFEATLTNYLAMGILLELSARNIELPMKRIHLEKPYPEIHNNKSPGRADIFVDLADLFAEVHGSSLYGMKTNNWIEAKLFSGIDRQKGHPAKVDYVASIARDLFRLCLFIEEKSNINSNGRYIVMVFNRKPDKYLALKRQNKDYPEREWIKSLLDPGEKEIIISLEKEQKTFKQKFGYGLNHTKNIETRLRVMTRAFTPSEETSEHLYWGYLVRIIDFEIVLGDERLIHKDVSSKIWSEQQTAKQKRFIKELLETN
jgi:hypothetical protein